MLELNLWIHSNRARGYATYSLHSVFIYIYHTFVWLSIKFPHFGILPQIQAGDVLILIYVTSSIPTAMKSGAQQNHIADQPYPAPMKRHLLYV